MGFLFCSALLLVVVACGHARRLEGLSTGGFATEERASQAALQPSNSGRKCNQGCKDECADRKRKKRCRNKCVQRCKAAQSDLVQTAWDNHFDAFAAGASAGAPGDALEAALDKIMLDYDAESTIAVFNDECQSGWPDSRDGYEEYKTEAAIRGFFRNLFIQLEELTNVVALGPVGGGPVVKEGDLPEGNVFLTWRTKLTGPAEIKYATDTFSWQIKGKKALILKQNIVTTEPGKACASAASVPDACEALNPKPAMCAAWANHFDAFGQGAGAEGGAARITAALDQIMQDYTEDSLVQVFDNRVAVADGYASFKGIAEIRNMFDGLFADIEAARDATNGIGLGVKLLEVEPKFNGVFLVWEAFSHPKATDTFVFDDAGKIIRQNIVVSTKTTSDV